jgi:hypothetical protein
MPQLPVPVEILLAIIVVIKGLVDGLIRPTVEKFSWSPHLLRFGAWVIGVVLVILARFLPSADFMWVMLALVVGTGANVFHDFLSAIGQGNGS